MIATDESTEETRGELVGPDAESEGVFEEMISTLGLTSVKLSPSRAKAKINHDNMEFAVQVPHQDVTNYRGHFASAVISGAFNLADTPVGLPLAPV